MIFELYNSDSVVMGASICILDLFKQSNHDIFNPARTAAYKTASCNCLSNILSNSSYTNYDACDNTVCAAQCATKAFDVVC